MKKFKSALFLVSFVYACSAPSFKTNASANNPNGADAEPEKPAEAANLPGDETAAPPNSNDGLGKGAETNAPGGSNNPNDQNATGGSNNPNDQNATGGNTNHTFPAAQPSGAGISIIPGYAAGTPIVCANEATSLYSESVNASTSSPYSESGYMGQSTMKSYSRSCQSGLMNGLYGGGLVTETMRPDIPQNVMTQPSCCRLPASVSAIPLSTISLSIQIPTYNRSTSSYPEIRQTCPAQFPIFSGYQGEWNSGPNTGVGKAVNVTKMNCQAMLLHGKNLTVDSKPENLRYVHTVNISNVSQGAIGFFTSRITCPSGMVAIGHFFPTTSIHQVSSNGGHFHKQIICASVVAP